MPTCSAWSVCAHLVFLWQVRSQEAGGVSGQSEQKVLIQEIKGCSSGPLSEATGQPPFSSPLLGKELVGEGEVWPVFQDTDQRLAKHMRTQATVCGGNTGAGAGWGSTLHHGQVGSQSHKGLSRLPDTFHKPHRPKYQDRRRC